MHQMRISTNQVSSVKVGNPTNVKLWKSRRMKTKTECHEIEPNLWKDRAMPEGDNPSFWDEFITIHIRILKQVPKYLATGL
jgi:hypothetical protein